MIPHRIFTIVNARHVVSADGVHVEFISMHELEYRTGGRTVRLPIESYHSPDRAPDGVLVRTDDAYRWTNGKALNEAEINAMRADLEAASAPLRSTFRFDCAR